MQRLIEKYALMFIIGSTPMFFKLVDTTMFIDILWILGISFAIGLNNKVTREEKIIKERTK